MNMRLFSPDQAATILSTPDKSQLRRPFSSDRWTTDTAHDLRRRLQNKNTPYDDAVGVVFRTGGLPYVLAYAGISDAYLVDIHADAILSNIIRIRTLAHHQSWLKYRSSFSEGLSQRDADQFLSEYYRAAQSGLIGDFLPTQQNAIDIGICGVAGDFRKVAPYIAGLIRRDEKTVAYVNVTNVADTINTIRPEAGPASGMFEIGKAIGTLPLADDVVIVDSSGNLMPRIYSSENYPGVK